MNYRKSLLTALLAPMFTLGSGALATVHAAGYAVFTHGASALGQGNAVTAHSNDPSTIFYNPALMNKLDGTQVQLGTTAIFSSREYEAPAGGNSTSSNAAHLPSTVYATHKLTDSVSLGIGMFNPFGLSTDWNENWDGRYLATKSKMTTFNFNPALSVRVLPSLSIAAGIDVVLLDASLERKVPTAAPPLAALGFPAGYDINQKFKGDGSGVGFNVGAAYDICDHLSVGAHYRSQVHIDVTGDATFSNPVLSSLGVPVSALNSGGKTSITLPPQFTAGVAMKPVDKLTMEAGVRWEGWSKFKELAVTLDNGSNATTPRNWKDSWGMNLGGRYQLDPTVAILAGYVWGDTAVPDSTFDPSIPDSKAHVFCLGTDLDFKPFTLAASYGYQVYESRTKSNSLGSSPDPTTAANGNYKTDAHLVALSLGYKF